MTVFSADRVRALARAMERVGWLAVVMAALALSFVMVSTIVLLAPVGRTFADWLTYVHAVERMFAGQPIYASEQLAGPYVLPNVTLFGYAYPPSSVPLFIPFVSYPAGLVLWLTLNVGLLITGIVAVLKRERGRVRPLELALTLIALAFMRGFAEGVAFGNASVGLAGFLAWSWALRRGSSGIGRLAGIGATIKLVPGVLIFWSTRRTVVRVFAQTVLMAGALFLVSLPAVGVGAWADYLKALSFSEPACGVDGPVSIACFLKPIIGIGPAKLAGIGIAIVAGGLAVLVRPPLVAFALVVLAWLAPVTDLHYHYLLVVYVLVVVTGARWLQRWTGGELSSDDVSPLEGRSGSR